MASWTDLRRNLPMFLDFSYAETLAALAKVDATHYLASVKASYIDPANAWVDTLKFLTWLDSRTN